MIWSYAGLIGSLLCLFLPGFHWSLGSDFLCVLGGPLFSQQSSFTFSLLSPGGDTSFIPAVLHDFT